MEEGAGQRGIQVTAEELRQGFHYYNLDGAATRAMETLTGGAFLVGLALWLGASDFLIGVIAALPFLSQVMHIPAVWVVERFRRRKLISVTALAISRPLLFVVALVPLFIVTKLALGIIICVLLLRSLIATFAGLSWNSWIRDLIPEEVRGQALARRLIAVGIAGMVLSLAAAAFVDYWKASFTPGPMPFSILFVLGGLAGIIGVYFLARIPEPPMPPPEGRLPLLRLLGLPLRDQNFRKLISYSSYWAFATNLALPFITVYMLKVLELPYIYVLAFAALSQLAYLGFVRAWGVIADRFGNKAVLYLCTPVFSLSLILWIFTVKGNPIITLGLIALIHLMNGIATAGLDLGNNNILLKLASPKRPSAYFAAASMINSLVAGIAPLVGGLLASFFANKELLLDLTWVSGAGQWQLRPLRLFYLDFLFLLAFLLGWYALRRLMLVREVEQEAPRREVVRAVRNEIGNISTIRGLRRLTHAASYFAWMLLEMGGLLGKRGR